MKTRVCTPRINVRQVWSSFVILALESRARVSRASWPTRPVMSMSFRVHWEMLPQWQWWAPTQTTNTNKHCSHTQERHRLPLCMSNVPLVLFCFVFWVEGWVTYPNEPHWYHLTYPQCIFKSRIYFILFSFCFLSATYHSAVINFRHIRSGSLPFLNKQRSMRNLPGF